MKNTLKKETIDTLFKKGKWISSQNINAIYLPDTTFNYMVSAPIKKFRRAVDRNRIKRLLRQSIFSQKSKPISISFIYTSTKILDYESINNDIKNILNKIK